MKGNKKSDLEPLVLQNLLDCNIVAILRCSDKPGLEHDTKGTVADDFAVGVGDLSGLGRLAVGSNNFHDFVGVVDG